jgi:uncharacterized protein YkwD
MVAISPASTSKKFLDWGTKIKLTALLTLIFLSGCQCYIDGLANKYLEDSERQLFLKAHNAKRKQEGLKPLVRNESLEERASVWADYLASYCHGAYYTTENGYNENVAQAWGVRKTPIRAVAWFYVCHYNDWSY